LARSQSLTVPTDATPLRDSSCTTARGGMMRSASIVSRMRGRLLLCRLSTAPELVMYRRTMGYRLGLLGPYMSR
jgi:hypothetical protein